MMDLLTMRVDSEWIDYNGHMNVAYYHLAFDRATERLLERIGLGEEYRRRRNGSMFALEDRMSYQRELQEGDPLRITGQILDFDHKRLHYFLRMFHAERDYLASTCEHLSTFVDMEQRRSAPLPEEVVAEVRRLFEEQGELSRPEETTTPIGIRRLA